VCKPSRLALQAVTPSPASEVFRQGLRDLGYVEDQNLIIERRYAERSEERASCNGPQTVSDELANKGSFQLAIRANKRSDEPTIIANKPTLNATSLQTAM
jgi:hypothetical protein